MSRTRRMFTPSQKAEVVRRHLKDQVPVSKKTCGNTFRKNASWRFVRKLALREEADWGIKAADLIVILLVDNS